MYSRFVPPLVYQPYRLHQQNSSANRSHSVPPGYRLPTVSTRLHCLTPCFNLSQVFIPQTPQRLPCKSSRDTVLLSSLPTLDQPTSMPPFQDSSKCGRRLARLRRTSGTSKIAEPVCSPATFARKVSAPPPSSFVSITGRKPAHSHTSRARTVGPTRTRNRFTAAYKDDEPDSADDLTSMP
jgi:hypothetical protein